MNVDTTTETTTKTTGHAGTGGLQRHSLGDDYPFCVIGREDDPATGKHQYQAVNLVGGFRGKVHKTYEECQTEIEWQKCATLIRDKCLTEPAFRLGYICRNAGFKTGNLFHPESPEYGQFGHGFYEATRLASLAEVCLG